MFCKNCGNQIPEGVAFCAACGTAAAPAAAPAAAVAPKADKSGLIKLIAIVAAVAIVLGLLISLLGGGSPKSVAKDYIKASFEGDYKELYSLMPGKYQKYVEKELYDDDDIQERLFENAEKEADELDIKVKVKNFNQFYNAQKKIAKAENKEVYGKNYKISVKVIDVKDMRSSELEAIQDRYDTDNFEDYVKADKIKKGKKVYVSVIIDGNEDNNSYVNAVYVVKYGGKWKVSHVGPDDREKD
ncbi:MAG: zinc-ribbon domain-containing protein [Clostridia bacterium]|nr:zinc-ribbon domain-containing protein [Clostridia bacterium]